MFGRPGKQKQIEFLDLSASWELCSFTVAISVKLLYYATVIHKIIPQGHCFDSILHTSFKIPTHVFTLHIDAMHIYI
jgi:hypothetical protein